ncbi:hypothetical protein NBRC111894_935 [Sporolactobacillus inulinus]|uniref:Uncharacterized protein n=1 Tax=Sporolactobacillus inulinus TaxID=2078 RepID=A0A4Y1Z908_9BACL|nr:hypothetical protein NBRC111894_935 [Sporolactobacillus inulinus]
MARQAFQRRGSSGWIGENFFVSSLQKIKNWWFNKCAKRNCYDLQIEKGVLYGKEIKSR